MTVDLAALAKLASEAIAEAPATSTWGVFGDPHDIVSEADAAYIAASSPDVVLALVRVALAARITVERTVNIPLAAFELRAALADLDR